MQDKKELHWLTPSKRHITKHVDGTIIALTSKRDATGKLEFGLTA